MTVDSAGCDRFESEETAGRYAAGTLSTEERDAFEAHLLECEQCRDEVRLAEAIRDTFQREEAEGHEPPSRSDGSSWPSWFRVAAAIVAVAGLGFAGLMLLRVPEVPSELSELGRVVQPPVYLGMSVRSPATTPDSLFNRAMQSYESERYSDAVEGLRATIEAGGDTPPVYFFLGASLLMLDLPGEAIEAFDHVKSFGNTSYTPETRFYRAKALLREGRTREAMEELRSAAAIESSIAQSAAALADSVEEAMQ